MHCLWPAPRLQSPFVLVRATCRWRWVWNTGRMTRENRSTWWKTCPNITLSPTNPTCTALRLNSGLHRECPATNRLVRPLPVCEKSYKIWLRCGHPPPCRHEADRTPRQYRTLGRRQEPAGGLMTGVRIQRSQRSTNTSNCHMSSGIIHLPLTLKNPHFTRLCI